MRANRTGHSPQGGGAEVVRDSCIQGCWFGQKGSIWGCWNKGQAAVIVWREWEYHRKSMAWPYKLRTKIPVQQCAWGLSHRGSPRILEWIAYPFSSVSSQPRNHTGVSCIAGRFFTNCLQLVSVFLVSELPFLAFQFYSLMNSDSVIPQPHQGLKSDFTTFLFDSQSLHLLPLLLPLTAYPNFIP